MSTVNTVKAQIQALTDKANAKMKKNYGDLTSAVNALIAGYGAVETVCSHENFKIDTTGHGNNTHTVEKICLDCGEVLSKTTEICVDANKDGECDKCGSEFSCNHENMQTVYTKIDKVGFHLATDICPDCGLVDELGEVPCVYEDGGSECLDCGACSHNSQGTGYTHNGDGTHTTKTICRSCRKVISETVEDCSDANGDNICDICVGTMGEVWEYSVGQLRGYHGHKAIVNTSGSLASAILKNALLVGAASGNSGDFVASFGSQTGEGTVSMYAIPIPATAKRAVFNIGVGTKDASAVLIKGTVESVIESKEQATSVYNSKATVNITAGAWDYMLLCIKDAGTSGTAVENAAGSATLTFT